MPPKKRKIDPVESGAAAAAEASAGNHRQVPAFSEPKPRGAAAAAEASAGNHRQEPASSEPNPRGTIYFPITDDPPEPAADEDEDEDEGAGDDEDDVEDIGKLLEPLSREQLVALLRTAAEASPASMAAVRRAAEADPASRKLFVHGLGWGAGAEDLRSAFSRFGELEDCRVISDNKQSGRSKCYGFVLFRSRRSALRALSRRPQLQIGGRPAFCRLAASGSCPAPPASQSQNPSSNANTTNASGSSSSQPDNMPRKIFVGNVHADVDVDRLYEYFAQFGEIEEGPLGLDKNTGKPTGSALFVYKSVEGARRALEEPVKNFDGKTLNVEKATDGRTKGSSGKNTNADSNPSTASVAAAAISPYDAHQAAMLGLVAQQPAFAQPNAMLAMIGMDSSSSSSAGCFGVLQKMSMGRSAYGILQSEAAKKNADAWLALEERRVSNMEKKVDLRRRMLELKKDEQTDKVMLVDTEKLPPLARRYYIKKQKQIAAAAGIKVDDDEE